MFLPNTLTLKPGDTGDFVRELQRRLAARDLLGEGEITSHYDGGTTQAVTSFQSQVGLKSDGIASPDTIRALNRLFAGGTASGGGDAYQSDEEQDKAASELQTRHEIVNAWQTEAQQGQNPKIIDPLREQRQRDESIATQSLQQEQFAPVFGTKQPAAQPTPEPLREGQNQTHVIANELNARDQLRDIPQPMQEAIREPIPPIPAPPTPEQAARMPLEQTVPPIASQPLVMETSAPIMPEKSEIRILDPRLRTLEGRLSPQSRIEAHEAGVVMLARGVRETPLPAGTTEIPAPSQTPTRAPAVQQQIS